MVGHGDWRAEHVRFLSNKPVVAFDWDSLCREHEPALIGAAANGFCADWSKGDSRQAPSVDEARAFVRDYEEARGEMFSAEERRLCGACLAYASAYTARCGPMRLARTSAISQGLFNISFGANAVIFLTCRCLMPQMVLLGRQALTVKRLFLSQKRGSPRIRPLRLVSQASRGHELAIGAVVSRRLHLFG